MRSAILSCLILCPGIWAKFNDRIIGGHEAKPHQIPYQVLLEILTSDKPGTRLCTGTIVSERFILTSASCLINAGTIYANAGTNTNPPPPDAISFYCIRSIMHPDFDNGTLKNDIGIVGTYGDFQFSERIQPVKLPSRRDIENTYDGVNGRVSSWGSTEATSPDMSPVLNYVDLDVIPLEDCKKSFAGLDGSQFCASGDGTVCIGDAGAPFVDNASGVQIGIASFGAPDCGVEYPNGFTRVASYLDFIEANTDVVIE